ncbi:unnamed protein product [Moneuplotes crassus]|uniref:Uncharacterized protein n=1 Tax=Euplotes crassus TaxID=5936 RepID=A0AAD1XSS9_EUPCR|nr:unnamed protein product [Moneuplotes crassus]
MLMYYQSLSWPFCIDTSTDSFLYGCFSKTLDEPAFIPLNIHSIDFDKTNDFILYEANCESAQKITASKEDKTNHPEGEQMESDRNNFLKYLDSHFVPEIKLEDKNRDTQISPTHRVISKLNSDSSAHNFTKESLNEVHSVSLSYKGQKNSFKKGASAERVDIVHKTLLRSIRRFLYELLNKEHNLQDITDKPKSSTQFQNKLLTFYSKYFKVVQESISISDEDSQLFIQNLASFVTSNYWLPGNSFRIRKFRSMIKKNLKQYSVRKYSEFYKLEGCSKFYEVLYKSGFIQRIIEAYPKLKESKDSYYRAVEDIMQRE